MWLGWFPWRWIVRRAARNRGFMDPLSVLAKLERFAQPSEVAAPIELLRAGMVMHARGLMNTKAIQHNLDWIWPYWVERQFDPRDSSFIPRAFSITHINLTHRNWTAVGLPQCEAMPLVDPRGLVTPHFDGWSIDFWLLPDGDEWLFPSRQASLVQRLVMHGGFAVETESRRSNGALLRTRAEVRPGDQDYAECIVSVRAECPRGGVLAAVLRPFNPEGVAPVHDISFDQKTNSFSLNGGAERVLLSSEPERVRFSNYRRGDVISGILDVAAASESAVSCEVGMAAAAAVFRCPEQGALSIEVRTPLHVDGEPGAPVPAPSLWRGASPRCALSVPDERWQFLFDAALRTVLLLSPGDIFAGPYTYKRFWFRDAALILHALITLNEPETARRAIARFGARQTAAGYYLSQEGEWDSNGQVLWILDLFHRTFGSRPSHAELQQIRRAARWIAKKRCPAVPASPHAGLLPAGFSAEHLGPNDFYYWDDLWGIAGLEAAARIAGRARDEHCAEEFRTEAASFRVALEESLSAACSRCDGAIPASPYRRMDAGAIGSLAYTYPLALCAPDDARVRASCEFLLHSCTVHGGFFQDMIHSGINIYLTLHIAQALLRAGDPRYFDLAETAARLASPTGQWPEAIHPGTLGGCMGDGQHGWACAEWLLMVRNMFVREEGGRLVLGSGLPKRWLDAGGELSFGPTATGFGSLRVTLLPASDSLGVRWEAAWHAEQPQMEIAVAGFERRIVTAGHSCVLRRT